VFERFTESDSEMHVEFGMVTKHAMKGYGTFPLQMESRGILRVQDVLWVPELKRSVILVSMIEKKGFDVAFQDGNVLIMPIGSNSEKLIFFGVIERNLHMIKR